MKHGSAVKRWSATEHWIAAAASIAACTTATAGDSPARTIYRCESAQGPVFSDRPCSAVSEVYEPDLGRVSVVDTVSPPALPAPRSASAARPARQAAIQPKATACEGLERSLHKIVSTMRAGYNAKQGERLRERKRELEAKRRAEKC